ncbi:MAG TPA: TetR/AcrR family transcriptional regulator [Acidimicrobiales bacterium]
MAPAAAPAVTRERLLEAAFTCVARHGLAKTTIDDIARAAGVSRPTIYRQFPGGREAVLREVVAWEAARVFSEITRAVAGRTDLAELLEELVAVAYRTVGSHSVLQKVLQTEPERLLPLLVTGVDRLIALMKPLLLLGMQRSQVRPGLDHDAAADYIARMVLSVVGAPGRWDLDDRASIRAFVDRELLAGLR